MSSKSFGKPVQVKTSSDFIAELYELVGDKFPLELLVADGKVLQMSYETEWKEGTTKAVGTGKNTKYEADYTSKKLTKQQITKLDNWAAKNVAG